ncbi:TetR family transcriptional regulator [Streptococcus dentiloxodontae]
MARISKVEGLKRQEEIIDVCAELYQHMSFKEINIKEIGNRISFTRTAIYTYFDNKEEIFLALLEREYLAWEQDLQTMLVQESLNREAFAQSMADSLAKRQTMLKILAVDMSSLDCESRMEKLTAFKKVYGRSLSLMADILEKFQLTSGQEETECFIYAFFPFLYGIYPYTTVTEKQIEAMKQANVPYVFLSVEQIVKNNILTLLK